MDDLTKEEFDWLVSLSKGHGAMITTKIADRLKELRYATQLLGGVGITEEGKRRVREGWH